MAKAKEPAGKAGKDEGEAGELEALRERVAELEEKNRALE